MHLSLSIAKEKLSLSIAEENSLSVVDEKRGMLSEVAMQLLLKEEKIPCEEETLMQKDRCIC